MAKTGVKGGKKVVKEGKKIVKEVVEEAEEVAKGAAGKKAAKGGDKITGHTKHGINQAISREGKGVAAKAMKDAVKNPTKVVKQADGTTKYIGKDATVVLNKDGKVITTWPHGSSGVRNPGGGG